MLTVSLTFDDALDCHLDVAVPLLEEAGFRGTFFVPVGEESFTRRLDDWRAVAARGHELGNHTIEHPSFRGKSYVTEGNAIENYTVDRMRREVETANRILSGTDGQTDRTFAYPCCNDVLGRPGIAKRLLRRLGLDRTRVMGWVLKHPGWDVGSTEQSYETVVAQLCVAARKGGERFAAGRDYPPPRWAVPCVSLDGKTKDAVNAVLDSFVAYEHGWLVFMAHSIDGACRYSCDRAVLEWLLRMLRDQSIPVRTLRAATQLVFEVGLDGRRGAH